LISIYESDGTVLVQQGGVELGQGLMTKIAQIAAESLDIPLESIKMDATNTYVIANPSSTEASTGTTYNGSAVRKAGLMMRKRLEEFCQQCRQFKGVQWCKDNAINYWDYPGGWKTMVINPFTKKNVMMWTIIISQAYLHRVDLSVHALYRDKGVESADMNPNQFSGFVYSAACSEVEIDVLTGETNILRSDIVYDMGKSLNPAIDVGQVEGAFVMGIGNVLSEELVYDESGTLKTTGFRGYKVPAAGTIPERLNVDLFPREEASSAPENPYLLMAAKEVGEPPLVLASTVFFAIKRAILASRVERGKKEWFELQSPATVNRIREACRVDTGEMQT
ncbi:MAG: molybdopterin-dependent oxidoreductase, partial [bacterium]|nr:molybdopterin-dependent oxidoreductase [bacterium]